MFQDSQQGTDKILRQSQDIAETASLTACQRPASRVIDIDTPALQCRNDRLGKLLSGVTSAAVRPVSQAPHAWQARLFRARHGHTDNRQARQRIAAKMWAGLAAGASRRRARPVESFTHQAQREDVRTQNHPSRLPGATSSGKIPSVSAVTAGAEDGRMSRIVASTAAPRSSPEADMPVRQAGNAGNSHVLPQRFLSTRHHDKASRIMPP